MKYLELYDNTKTYISPIGELFTPEEVGRRYALINSGLPIVIETDSSHTIFGGYGLLSQYKDMYNIDDTLSDEEAIVKIQELANAPQPEPEPSAEERIASAMEFQNLMLL